MTEDLAGARFPSPSWRGLEKSDYGLMALAGFLAFFVRLLYLYSYSRSPYWDVMIMDPGNHWDLALRLAAGDAGGAYSYFRAPLYIWTLAGLVRLFGESLWPIRIFQALLGGASAAMTVRLGLLLVPRKAAAAAGIMAALYWGAVYFDGELLITSLASFLGLSSILLVLRADAEKGNALKRSLFWTSAGAAVGLMAIARPNALAFAVLVPPVLMARALYHGREKEKREQAEENRLSLKGSLWCSAFFCFGVASLVLPVAIRNWAVAKDPVLIASQGGINFWLGNHEGVDGRTVVIPMPGREVPADFIRDRRDHPFLKEDVWLTSTYLAQEALKKRVRGSETSSYWYGLAWDWMREHPTDAAVNFLKKTLYLFQRREVSNNRDLESHKGSFFPLRVLSAVHFGMIAPLSLAGLIVALRDPRRWLWPLLFFASWSATVIMFFVTERYRVPLYPLFFLLAASAVSEILSGAARYRRSRKLQAAAAPAALALAALASAVPINADWPAWNDRPLRSAMRYNLGLAFAEREEWKQAEVEIRRALEIKDFHPEAYYLLGMSLEGQGRAEEAEAAYERCLEQAPDYAQAHFRLGRLILASSRPDSDRRRRGLDHLRRANLLAPDLYPRLE